MDEWPTEHWTLNKRTNERIYNDNCETNGYYSDKSNKSNLCDSYAILRARRSQVNTTFVWNHNETYTEQ